MPSAKTLYEDGPTGRYLIDGQWLFRLDAADQGLRQRFYRQTSHRRLDAGGRPERLERRATTPRRRCAAPSAGTARTSSCPTKRAALEWAARFESVNYRSRVWLNGREIGRNNGAYIPFTLRAEGAPPQRRQPARGPRRLAPAADRLPALGPEHARRRHRRLVELRRHPARGLPPAARHGGVRHGPRAAAAPAGRSATVDFTSRCENVTRRARRVSAIANFGGRRVGARHAPAARGADRAVRRAASGIANPTLWSPRRPVPLPGAASPRSSGGRTVGTYSLKSGIRSIRVARRAAATSTARR